MVIDNNSASLNAGAFVADMSNPQLVSGNTVNIEKKTTKISGVSNKLANFVRLLNPSSYEKREAEARLIRTESFIDCAKLLKQQFPFISNERAVLEALGYRVTNDQVSNIGKIFFDATRNFSADRINEADISPESRDAIIENSKNAYDEYAQKIWSKLLSNEIENPGSISKKAISILGEMDSNDARDFEHMCTYLLPDPDISVLILHEDQKYTFNDGNFNYDLRNKFESFGLINTSTAHIVYVPPKELVKIIFKEHKILNLINNSDEEKELSFSPALTQYGKELASLCREIWGTAPDILEFTRQIASDQGFIPYEYDEKESNKNV